jgi:hypothetical protein
MTLLASFLIILTKWLDCYSTVKRIPHASVERNRWARGWMQRFGVRQVVWAVLVLVVVIVAIYTALLYWMNLMYIHLAYWIIAVTISIVQLAIAHTNWTGRYNMITKWISQWKHYQY